VDFGDQFVIVRDTSNGFWFLPGGGVEQNESVEETAKREALEELGLGIKINRVIRVSGDFDFEKDGRTAHNSPFYASSCHTVKRATQPRVRF
jgi:8-oxo-dGTP diphosphatase